MDFCKNCGEKLNEASQVCTNCGSRIENAENNSAAVPGTRIGKRNDRSKRNKRLVAVVGSIIGLLLVLSVASLFIKGFSNHGPKTEVAATKPISQSKTNHVKNSTVTKHANQSTEKNNIERSNLSSSDYIFPDSDKTVLSTQDIGGLTKDQLRIARNEIYARHGYVFKSADLQKYFSSKTWYHEVPSYIGSLNEAEKENVKLLKTRENQL